MQTFYYNLNFLSKMQKKKKKKERERERKPYIFALLIFLAKS